MLDALNKSGQDGGGALLDNGRPGTDLDLAARQAAGGNRGGLAQLGASSGGGALVGVGGGTSAGTKIHGKALGDVADNDVKAALEEAGCTAKRATDAKAGTVFDATCPEHETVTFFAFGSALPAASALVELETGSAELRDAGVLVVIHPVDANDLPLAKRLLDKITNKAPVGKVALSSPIVHGGNVANAGAVVAGMAAGFRRCYKRGLETSPDAKGAVTVTATIDKSGAVTGASPKGGDGLPVDTVACVAARVAASQFAAPDSDGGARVEIRVTFSTDAAP